MPSVAYRLARFRPITLLVLGLMGIGALVAIAMLLSGSEAEPLVVFLLFWLAFYVWNAYWFLARVVYEITVVDGSTFRWRTITRTHQAPLAMLKSIDTPVSPFGTGVRRIKVEGNRSLLLIMAPGLPDLLALIVQLRPDLMIPNSWFDRVAQRFAKRTFQWVRVGG